jgi:D-alanine-D-alanine ligase
MKNIGVFCGGFSSEFEISLKSAQTIMDSFPEGYQPIKIIVAKQGWKAEFKDQHGKFDMNTGEVIFDQGDLKLDGAIVYIHGDPGENGKVQAYLDLIDIPYVNADALASSLSFDKWYCNQFLSSFGINVAKSVFLSASDPMDVSQWIKHLGLPIFVKPTNSGSSYGISKVKKADDLIPAIQNALKEGPTVVLESFLDGVEVTCGVYTHENQLIALPLTEIVSENEFFDYEAKYQGKSNEITPARISPEARDLIQTESRRIYKLLNLKSIARIDFMLVGDIPYVIEVNTTPGFSSESIVPKMLKEANISLNEFWKSIIESSL